MSIVIINTNAVCFKYAEKIKELQKIDDIEYAHSKADKILCELLEELGLKDIVEEYKKIDKWYA